VAWQEKPAFSYHKLKQIVYSPKFMTRNRSLLTLNRQQYRLSSDKARERERERERERDSVLLAIRN